MRSHGLRRRAFRSFKATLGRPDGLISIVLAMPWSTAKIFFPITGNYTTGYFTVPYKTLDEGFRQFVDPWTTERSLPLMGGRHIRPMREILWLAGKGAALLSFINELTTVFKSGVVGILQS